MTEKVRPMMFRTESIQPMLDDRKRITRRLVKHREFQPSTTPGYDWTFRDRRGLWQDVSNAQMLTRCPHGVIGDYLWVKERWKAVELDDGTDGVRFAAGDTFQKIEATFAAADQWVIAYNNGKHGDAWRSPLFMPRWASRIMLTITEVCIERLHDIGEYDARWEGVEPDVTHHSTYPSKHAAKAEHRSYRDGFKKAWHEIHGAESWGENPFVWVIRFGRLIGLGRVRAQLVAEGHAP